MAEVADFVRAQGQRAETLKGDLSSHQIKSEIDGSGWRREESSRDTEPIFTYWQTGKIGAALSACAIPSSMVNAELLILNGRHRIFLPGY